MYKRRIGSIISSSIEELGGLIKLSFRNNKSNDVDEEILHSTSTFKNINNSKKLKRRRTSSSSSTTNTRRKRVSFSSDVTSLEPSNNLSYRELKALWYDSATLFSFKKNAQKVILSSSSSDGNNNNSNDEAKSVNKEEESTTSTITTTCCMRGLENCTIERELQRKQIIRCIIRAYRNGRCKPEQIAKISSRCGSWNLQNAIQQANNDYCEVYQPSLQLPKICNEPPTSPFVVVDSSMSKNRRRRTASSSLSPHYHCRHH